MNATDIAAAVTVRQTSATAVIADCLARIDRLNPALNAFTTITADRARAKAALLDAAMAAGTPPGPLAGVPFAVKNLVDVAGIPTGPAAPSAGRWCRWRWGRIPTARSGCRRRSAACSG